MPATYRGGDPVRSPEVCVAWTVTQARALGWAACPTNWRSRLVARSSSACASSASTSCSSTPGTDFPPIIEGLAEAETHGIDGAALDRRATRARRDGRSRTATTSRPAGPQAVILHTNVGLANGAIGAINMATDHVPVILMSGRTPDDRSAAGSGRGPSRSVGARRCATRPRSCARRASGTTRCASPSRCPSCSTAPTRSPRRHPEGPRLPQPAPRGAVRAVPGRSARPPRSPCAPRRSWPRPDQITAAAELLARAERPLIIAQRGAGSPAGFEALARHRRAVVDPGVPVLGERHRDLHRAPDVRGPGPVPVGRRGGRDPRDRQPRPVDARRARAGGRVQGRAPRSQPVVQPVPGAQLPVRPGDHDRGRRRSRGARTGDARPRFGRRRCGAPDAPPGARRRPQRDPPRAVALPTSPREPARR